MFTMQQEASLPRELQERAGTRDADLGGSTTVIEDQYTLVGMREKAAQHTNNKDEYATWDSAFWY
ncbi:hypothetical protein LTR62_004685 [Meristemomyces frigidus]|uniref:Uncharacterized protein n=1 Tax=Meristemomyces frigidus TaxID=1508187 RepID=A0AAN7TLN6_9PEZI|nr:hypothetical protein LTR62_004685 [Meristemomyces frigidus]